MTTMPAWSHTSLSAFETCPKRYYLTRVSKEVVEPQTESTRWGNTVHKALELRLRDKTPLPEGMTAYEKFCARIEVTPGQLVTEQKLALNAHFQPVKWMAKDCWVRAVLDVSINAGAKAVVLDWKTGAKKHDPSQLKLSAAFAFHTYPAIEEVSTGFVWLREQKLSTERYTRDQLPEIWRDFLPRVRRVEIAFEEDKWEAKPSGLCKKYCPVGRHRCSHCGV
jgi:hypothetical protein